MDFNLATGSGIQLAFLALPLYEHPYYVSELNGPGDTIGRDEESMPHLVPPFPQLTFSHVYTDLIILCNCKVKKKNNVLQEVPVESFQKCPLSRLPGLLRRWPCRLPVAGARRRRGSAKLPVPRHPRRGHSSRMRRASGGL